MRSAFAEVRNHNPLWSAERTRAAGTRSAFSAAVRFTPFGAVLDRMVHTASTDRMSSKRAPGEERTPNSNYYSIRLVFAAVMAANGVQHTARHLIPLDQSMEDRSALFTLDTCSRDYSGIGVVFEGSAGRRVADIFLRTSTTAASTPTLPKSCPLPIAELAMVSPSALTVLWESLVPL